MQDVCYMFFISDACKGESLKWQLYKKKTLKIIKNKEFVTHEMELGLRIRGNSLFVKYFDHMLFMSQVVTINNFSLIFSYMQNKLFEFWISNFANRGFSALLRPVFLCGNNYEKACAKVNLHYGSTDKLLLSDLIMWLRKMAALDHGKLLTLYIACARSVSFCKN